MKTNHKKIIYPLMGVGLIGVVGIVGFSYTLFHKKSNLTTIESPSQMLIASRQEAKSNKLTFDYYHKTGCQDCQLVEKHGINKLLNKTAKTNKVNEIETTSFTKNEPQKAHFWYSANYVKYTPTLVAKYKGYAVYTYSGTNINYYKKLLSGKNPVTNKKLITAKVSKTKKPTVASIVNDFTHEHDEVVPYLITNLSSTTQNSSEGD